MRAAAVAALAAAVLAAACREEPERLCDRVRIVWPWFEIDAADDVAPEVEGMAVFGPAPAPLAMLRGRHRQRLLVHARRSLDVQDVIRDWLAEVEWRARVRVSVDVDPYSFL